MARKKQRTFDPHAIPWHASEIGEVHDTRGNLVAECASPEVAQLVAAAPRLRALVTELVHWHEFYGGGEDIEHHLGDFWRDARAALAEAGAPYVKPAAHHPQRSRDQVPMTPEGRRAALALMTPEQLAMAAAFLGTAPDVEALAARIEAEPC